MSVLIKGMEMPTSCSVCPMLEGDRMDGLCHAASKWLDDDEHWTWYVYSEGDIDNSKPCNCPLISVPPHGRLIDADALNYNMLYKEDWIAGTGVEAPAIWKKDVESAPTIIPAEEGE